jgi:UPF0716 protein FxsA
MAKFLLFFVFMTIAEVFVMKEVAERIGYINLLFMVLFTGFLGISLAKQQGKEHLSLFQKELSAGKMPGHPILEGLMILVAAVVLITPGFLTDLIGFSLLLPPVRKLASPILVKLFKGKSMTGNNFQFHSNMGSESFKSRSSSQDLPPNGETFDMPEQSDDKKIE